MDIKERVAILRRVSLFTEVPERELTQLAALLEEMRTPAGTTIFEKGEKGYCLYIMVSGRIRIHDGAFTLSYLGKQDVFGEMAALAPEPRIASATAMEETLLLQLYERPLYNLMRDHVKVIRGVINVLCRHLRVRVRELSDDFAYRREVQRVADALAAVRANTPAPDALTDLTLRDDELGETARNLQALSHEFRALREQGNRAERK